MAQQFFPWGSLLSCGGLPIRLVGHYKTPNSAIGNRAQDGILPHRKNCIIYPSLLAGG